MNACFLNISKSELICCGCVRHLFCRAIGDIFELAAQGDLSVHKEAISSKISVALGALDKYVRMENPLSKILIKIKRSNNLS